MLEELELKIVRMTEAAVLPKYAHDTDAGLDLTATSREYDHNTDCYIFGTGLKMEIPEGYVGLLFPRSSVYKTHMDMTNCVGVIDAGYRGEVKVIFRPTMNEPAKHYKVGERVAQLIVMPYPKVKCKEVFELSESDRGEGGHGSTGK